MADINIVINDATQAVSSAGFGLALIVDLDGSNSYTEYDISEGLASVAADYATNTRAYRMAAAISSQSPNPGRVAIAGVGIFTEKTDVGSTNLTLDSGTTYTFSQTNVLPGSIAGLTDDGVDIPNTAIESIDYAAGTITLKESPTAVVAVTGFSHLLDPTTIVTELNNIIVDDNDWYFLLCGCELGNYLIEKALSDWAGANKKLHFARTNVTEATYPIAISQNRTGSFLTKLDEFLDGAAASYMGARLPGSLTMKFKQFNGINPSAFRGSELTNARTNRLIAYLTKNSLAQTDEGWSRGTLFLDQVRGRDWLESEITARIISLFVSRDKVPFTDDGIQEVADALEGALLTATTNGLIGTAPNGDPLFTITTPTLTSISPGDRATRTLTGLSATIQEAGAIHMVDPLTINIVANL